MPFTPPATPWPGIPTSRYKMRRLISKLILVLSITHFVNPIIVVYAIVLVYNCTQRTSNHMKHLKPYEGGKLIVPCGEIVLRIFFKGRSFQICFFVANDSSYPIENILGLPTVEVVELVKLTFAISPLSSSKSSMFVDYPDVFYEQTGDIPG